MSANGLLINRSNIGELTPKDLLLFNSKEYWHKFILENGGLYDKEAILLAVLDSVAPFDIVPVKYTVEGSDAYFLARNCGQAIEKFCLNLLDPINLKEYQGEVIMSIQICSLPIEQYKVNMQYHLRKAIEKRYDANKKGFINLSSFHKEPGLFEVFFCPLSKPRFLMYVLSILKRTLPITAINLSNNKIEMLTSLKMLQEFKGLVSLDLSNNEIKDPSVLDLLGKAVPDLKELNLSGNPICNAFEKDNYVKWITEKFHSISKIDGVYIYNRIPNIQINVSLGKPMRVINEFLRHYFTTYDDNRVVLKHTYEKNAIFSMTCDNFSSHQHKSSKLECYQQDSRHLMKVYDENKIFGTAHQNNISIIDVFWKLPLTEHDPSSLKIDIMYYREPFIVLVVTGIFRDYQEAPRIRSFTRTFALRRVSRYECKIINDMHHVRNATAEEINNSFQHTIPQLENVVNACLVTKDEKQNSSKVFSELTKMNFFYCKSCLRECKWNVKKALKIFLKNYRACTIPPAAFT